MKKDTSTLGVGDYFDKSISAQCMLWYACYKSLDLEKFPNVFLCIILQKWSKSDASHKGKRRYWHSGHAVCFEIRWLVGMRFQILESFDGCTIDLPHVFIR